MINEDHMEKITFEDRLKGEKYICIYIAKRLFQDEGIVNIKRGWKVPVMFRE